MNNAGTLIEGAIKLLEDDSETNPLGMPEELWDEVKEMQEDGLGFKTMVATILDSPLGRNWFETYKGNEFDLRQELEDALTPEEPEIK